MNPRNRQAAEEALREIRRMQREVEQAAELAAERVDAVPQSRMFHVPGMWTSPDDFADLPWPPPGGYLKPRDLPELRRRLVNWLNPETGDAYNFHFHQSYDNAKAHFGDHITPNTYPDYVRQLVETEHQNVKRARLYYVTEEMTRQVQQAVTSLPLFRARAEDLCAPAGMMVFERPVWGYTRHGQAATLYGKSDDGPEETLATFADDEHVPIVMLTWGVLKPKERGMFAGFEDGGLWMSMYRWTGEALATQHAQIEPWILEDMQRKFPPFIPDNEYGMAFDLAQRFDPEEDQKQLAEADNPNTAGWYFKCLVAASLMMKRPVFIQRREQVELGRKDRQRLARAGIGDHSVTVVDARPRKFADAGDGEHVIERSTGRKLTKRSYVSAHWRNQWYRSQGRHQPKWIEEHWRGPEDGELSNTDKMLANLHTASDTVRVLKS